MDHIAERDWKLLRDLKPVALDRFCSQVLSEAGPLIADSTSSNHKRFLDLFDLVMRRNEDLADAFDDLRRSTAVYRLARIYSNKLLTDDEFSRFSPETRERVHALLSLRLK